MVRGHFIGVVYVAFLYLFIVLVELVDDELKLILTLQEGVVDKLYIYGVGCWLDLVDEFGGVFALLVEPVRLG